MPLYLKYVNRTKICPNLVEDENGEKRRCGAEFVTTNPAAKYCEKCRKTKTWGTPALKRLCA